jgi:hypothetical protein
MKNTETPLAELTPAEYTRLSTDRRLRDYPAAELFEPREWNWLQFQRWLVDTGRLTSGQKEATRWR